MRWLLVIVLATSCGGGSPEVKQTTQTAGAGSAATNPTPKATGSAAPVDVSAPDVGCLTTTCAYHQATATYFTCLAGGAGVCFHFGAACTPPESCMVDASDRTYKKCGNAVEGVCSQFGAACAPANHCMFSFDDGLYHHCEDVSGGTCKRYGALCAP